MARQGWQQRGTGEQQRDTDDDESDADALRAAVDAVDEETTDECPDDTGRPWGDGEKSHGFETQPVGGGQLRCY